MTNKFSRRNLLKTSLVGITAGIAGCISSNSSNDDSKTTTEPEPNKDDSTPTDTPTPTEEPETSYTGLQGLFNNVPSRDWLINEEGENLVESRTGLRSGQEILDGVGMSHKNYMDIRESVDPEIWDMMAEYEGGGREKDNYLSGRFKENTLGIDPKHVTDRTMGKAGGELLTFDVDQQTVWEGLQSGGEFEYTPVKPENGGVKHGWTVHKGSYEIEGAEGTGRGLVATRYDETEGTQAIFVNTLTDDMSSTNGEPKIKDLDKYLDLWIETVNTEEDGEGNDRLGYAQTDKQVGKLQDIYQKGDWDSIRITDYSDPIDTEYKSDREGSVASARMHNHKGQDVDIKEVVIYDDGSMKEGVFRREGKIDEGEIATIGIRELRDTNNFGPI